MKKFTYTKSFITISLLALCSTCLAQVNTDRTYAVRVCKPERRTIAQNLIKTGSLTAPSIVDISPKVSGRLISTSINDNEIVEGTVVKKGQVIAKIDDKEFIIAKKIAEADLLNASANLDDAQREYDRTNALFKEDTSTKQELDKALTTLECAKAVHLKAVAALENATLNLEETQIVAPFDGIVSKKHLHMGSMVSPSSTIYSITKNNPLDILLDVPTTIYPLLKKKQTSISFEIDAYPEESIELTIDEIYPNADSTTRTITIKSILPNNDNKYTPGMFAKGNIALNERNDVLVVPFDAILRNVDKYFVYVVKDNTAILTPIEIGIRHDDVIEVVKGISTDDTIISDGLYRLANGVKINIVK